MNLDTNKDGTTDAGEILSAVQGFLSATVRDVNRVLQTALLVLTAAATLWTLMHPAQAVPVPVDVPTTGPVPVPALPDAPKAPEPPADTDAPAPAPVDAVAPVGGGS